MLVIVGLNWRSPEDGIERRTPSKVKASTCKGTYIMKNPYEANNDKKYAWKRIPPKNGDPSIKKVHVNGTSKTSYWCPHHLQWTVHSPKECKRLPVGK
jgi:hypothetical protein